MMFSFAAISLSLPIILSFLSVSALPLNTTRRAVNANQFDDLVFYMQYASSAYLPKCAKPNGNTLVKQLNDARTDTQGFIVRDDNKGELVVVMRGSSSATDFAIDADTTLEAMDISGVSPDTDVKVHRGFQKAWNSVVDDVLNTVKDEMAANPNLTLATSGHSLGGSLSSLAGITLQQNFPGVPLKMFTYGQPRTGNQAYADFVNTQVGAANSFRGVHTNDGVPTIIPEALGFAHHGTEFFQNPDPASAATTKACDPAGEDPTCSAAIPSGGINAAHLEYFNIKLATPFCN